MADCNTGDYQFPLSAEIYHPIVEQGSYGNVKKQWMFDRTISLSLSTPGTAMKEEVAPTST